MKIKKLLPLLTILFLATPFIVSAQPPGGGWSLQDVLDFFDTVANWLYAIGFALALVIIIIGGIQYMTAGGADEKVQKAKKTIITGLIGAAIILLAGIILDTLAKFLGVNPPA